MILQDCPLVYSDCQTLVGYMQFILTCLQMPFKTKAKKKISGIIIFLFNSQAVCFCCSKIVQLFICSSQKVKNEGEPFNLQCINFRAQESAKIWLGVSNKLVLPGPSLHLKQTRVYELGVGFCSELWFPLPICMGRRGWQPELFLRCCVILLIKTQI